MLCKFIYIINKHPKKSSVLLLWIYSLLAWGSTTYQSRQKLDIRSCLCASMLTAAQNKNESMFNNKMLVTYHSNRNSFRLDICSLLVLSRFQTSRKCLKVQNERQQNPLFKVNRAPKPSASLCTHVTVKKCGTNLQNSAAAVVMVVELFYLSASLFGNALC